MLNECMRISVLFLSTLIVFSTLSATSKSNEELAKVFFKQSAFSHFKLSPDGTHLAYKVLDNGKPSLRALNLITGKSIQAKYPHAVYYPYHAWVDNDTLFYALVPPNLTDYPWSPNARIFSEWYTVELSEKSAEKATVSYLPLRYRHNLPNVSDTMLVESLATTGLFKKKEQQYYDISTLETKSGSISKTISNPGNIRYWMTDNNGVVKIGFEYEQRGGTRKGIYRLGEGDEWQPIQLPGNTIIGDFLPDNEHFYVAYANGKNTLGLYIYSLREKKMVREVWHSPRYSLNSGFAFSKDNLTTNSIAFVAFTDRIQINYLSKEWFDVSRELKSEFPNTLAWPVGLALGRSVYFFDVLSDVNPGMLVAYYKTEKKVVKVMDYYPNLVDQKIIETLPIVIPTNSGVQLEGYLTTPDKSKKLPTIFLVRNVYSSNGFLSSEVWGYDIVVQYLAQLGYAVVRVNCRGTAGYDESSYSISDYSFPIKNAAEDISAAVEWSISEGYSDRQNIAIIGQYFGGYIAMDTLKRFPDLFKGAILMDGTYDLWQEKTDSKPDRNLEPTDGWLNKYGDPLLTDEFLVENSATSNLNTIKAPVVLVDLSERTKQANTLYRALKNEKKNVTRIMISGTRFDSGTSEGWGEVYIEIAKQLEDFFQNE